MKNYRSLLWGALGFVALFVRCDPAPSSESSIVNEPAEPIRLSASAFADTLRARDDEQLIDVRTPAEYAAGHLPGATMIDFRDEDFREKMTRLDPHRPVMVYCAAGGRSTAAAALLEKLGHSEVYELKGGITRWKEAGKAIE